MAARIRPLATQGREPGQVRKEAAAAVAVGAGVWRVRAVTQFMAVIAGLFRHF